MARVPGSEATLDVLVNCKTYPAVSKKYIETVCTGGVDREGRFTRLYPIPFRFLEDKEQYDRWDVIRVKVYRDTKDSRPESWHIEPGAKINIIDHIASENARWTWIRPAIFDSSEEMDRRGITNGLVEIIPTELYWESETKVWSPNQMDVLTQGNLWHDEKLMQSLSERVPWQFKLRFSEKNSGKQFDQKVLAWSYYQGFRRQLRHVQSEESALHAVRDRVYKSIMNPERAVFAIFGTHSRFKHWMISGLYHVPKKISGEARLF